MAAVSNFWSWGICPHLDISTSEYEGVWPKPKDRRTPDISIIKALLLYTIIRFLQCSIATERAIILAREMQRCLKAVTWSIGLSETCRTQKGQVKVRLQSEETIVFSRHTKRCTIIGDAIMTSNEAQWAMISCGAMQFHRTGMVCLQCNNCVIHTWALQDDLITVGHYTNLYSFTFLLQHYS